MRKLSIGLGAALLLWGSALAQQSNLTLAPEEQAMAQSTGKAFGSQALAIDLEIFGDRRFLGQAGVLVAEGDSWFDYPQADVLKMLRRRHDYTIESVAHYGHTLDSMAYDRAQLAGVAGQLKSLHDRNIIPKAILVSAGGNDIAGPELGVMLNNSRSGLEKLNPTIANELIFRRFRVAMVTLLSAITEISIRMFDRQIPILVHGYDYPVPDGRGFLGGFWILPGPWMQPAFALKGDSQASGSPAQDQAVINSLIDDYNSMLEGLPSIEGLHHVRYVNLRGTLSADPANYKTDWGNELHPSPVGFRKVAERFQFILLQLP